MKAARRRGDRELVALQRAVTPDEMWKACDSLLRALGPTNHTILGLPSLGIMPYFLRTTLRVPAEYFARLSKVAPLADVVARFPGIPVSRMSDNFTPSAEFFAEFMAPAGWVHSMAMLFWDSRGTFLGHLGAMRAGEAGDFTDSEIREWEEIQPHVNGAILRLITLEKNAASRLSLERSVRSLPLPMVTVGWDGAVSFSNHSGREALHLWTHGAAARTLNASNELPPDLREACEALCAGWKAAMRANDLPGAERTRRLHHPSQPGLGVTIEIVEPLDGKVMQPSFALQFDVPHALNPEVVRALGDLRKLTPAEREVAILVAGGNGNAEIAERLGVSLNTVRTHLRHIFEKLGIKSRAKLAPLLQAFDDSCLREAGGA